MEFILNIIKNNKLKIFIFLCFSLFASLLGILTLVFINEYLLKSKEVNLIFIIYFLIILFLFFISSFLIEISLTLFGQNFIFSMQKRLIKQVLDSSVITLNKVGKAKILASLSSDIRNISFGLLRFPEFLQASILIICACFYLAHLSFEIFIFSFVWIFFVFLSNHFLMMNVYKYFKKARENDDALQSDYQNILDGHKELKINIFRAKKYYENEFLINAKNKKKNSTIGNILNNFSNNFTNTSLLALVGVQFFIALYFQITSLENAITIALSILFLRTPLVAMINSFPSLILAKIALDKISKLELKKYDENFKQISADIKWNKISFKNVDFAYKNFILKPTTLEINKGELIFLIGKNGSGKTTFCALMCALIKPNNGEIFLDNELITNENIDKYRSLISVIFSEFHLFKELLAKNDYALTKDINYYLDILKIKDKVEISNNKILNTNLSSGQRKRLAMLVSLLEQRDILILDEWAADQDPVFRKFFYEELLPLLKKQGKTIFAITHDDTYFGIADRIFMADNGTIKELKENAQKLAKNLMANF